MHAHQLLPAVALLPCWRLQQATDDCPLNACMKQIILTGLAGRDRHFHQGGASFLQMHAAFDITIVSAVVICTVQDRICICDVGRLVAEDKPRAKCLRWHSQEDVRAEQGGLA